jgi:hypothetical protein
MERTGELITKIYNDANEFIQLQSKSVKLEIYERVTNLISSGINAAILTIFGLIAFLFINIGLAFWLGEVFGSSKYGFLALGGFYLLVMVIYMLIISKSQNTKIKNSILFKVSKTYNDYNTLVSEQETLKSNIKKSESQIKESVEELKSNFQALQDDLKKFKSNFVTEQKDNANETVGATIPRLAMTTVVDLIMTRVLFRKAGLVKRTLLPLITNVLLTSSVFKENKFTSLIENLKLKFPNLFR